MSTQTLFTPPSDAELMAEIRQYAPKLTLYNGGDDFFARDVSGTICRFTPDLKGKEVRHPETGKLVKCDGLLLVSDRYGRLQDPMRRTFTGATGLVPGGSSIEVMKYLVLNYGERGIVWLRGDGRDEERKQAAKTLYRNFRRGWAEGQRERRNSDLERHKKDPNAANRELPRPTNDQRRAQILLDSMADEGLGLYEFVCKFGCSDFEKFDDYARHMKKNHGIDAPPPGPQAEPENLVAPDPVAMSDAEPGIEEIPVVPAVPAALTGAQAELLLDRVAELEAKLAAMAAKPPVVPPAPSATEPGDEDEDEDTPLNTGKGKRGKK